MNGHLSLEAARAYKAVGGPQDEWPQMVWRLSTTGAVSGIQFALDWRAIWPAAHEWYAAPAYVSSDGSGALDWLEQKEDLRFWWQRTPSGYSAFLNHARVETPQGPWFATVSDLLDAILEKLGGTI